MYNIGQLLIIFVLLFDINNHSSTAMMSSIRSKLIPRILRSKLCQRNPRLNLCQQQQTTSDVVIVDDQQQHSLNADIDVNHWSVICDQRPDFAICQHRPISKIVRVASADKNDISKKRKLSRNRQQQHPNKLIELIDVQEGSGEEPLTQQQQHQKQQSLLIFNRNYRISRDIQPLNY